MKFTHDQLDPISLQLKRVDDDLEYLREELRPYYPDNSYEPSTTLDELDDLAVSLGDEVVKLQKLIAALADQEADEPDEGAYLRPDEEAEHPEFQLYDTTRELHDDLGTFDRSPRD